MGVIEPRDVDFRSVVRMVGGIQGVPPHAVKPLSAGLFGCSPRARADVEPWTTRFGWQRLKGLEETLRQRKQHQGADLIRRLLDERRRVLNPWLDLPGVLPDRFSLPDWDPRLRNLLRVSSQLLAAFPRMTLPTGGLNENALSLVAEILFRIGPPTKPTRASGKDLTSSTNERRDLGALRRQIHEARALASMPDAHALLASFRAISRQFERSREVRRIWVRVGYAR